MSPFFLSLSIRRPCRPSSSSPSSSRRPAFLYVVTGVRECPGSGKQHRHRQEQHSNQVHVVLLLGLVNPTRHWLLRSAHACGYDRHLAASPASNAGMRLAEIWRYPVKSMAGERLTEAEIGPEGIPGDRVVHVEDQRGRVVTSRSRPQLLLPPRDAGRGRRAAGRRPPLARPRSRDDVEKAAGSRRPAAARRRLDRFDVLPLLGRDRRCGRVARLRPAAVSAEPAHRGRPRAGRARVGRQRASRRAAR